MTDSMTENRTAASAGNKRPDKRIAVGIAVLVAAAAIMAGIFFLFRQEPSEGGKQITITVVDSAGESASWELHTHAEYLRQAMEEAEGLTFSGEESEYGMMVHAVNGDVADSGTNGAYWAFYVNGEYCNYGIDSQPVEDGDAFLIEYTPAGGTE